MKAISKNLGFIVKQRRATLGITQQELANLAGCGIIFVHALESGKSTVRFEKLLQVMQALGLQFTLETGKDVISFKNFQTPKVKA